MAKPMEMLRDMPELLIKQTRKGCVQECLGCEATNEFKIYQNMDQAKANPEGMLMYSLEESSFCCRFCCTNNRSFTQTVWLGNKEAKQEVVLEMDRPFACPMQPCCCCNSPPFMQTMNMTEGGTSIGSAEIPCFLCIPAIMVKDAAGTTNYKVQMPSCCGGMCVDCMAEGCCNCKIPFYIYEPGTDAVNGTQIGKIIKLWRGLGTELFTDAASFQVEFPKDADPAAKARLIGTTMFINIQFFEKQDE